MSVNVGSAIGYLDLDTSKWSKGFKDAQKQMQGFTDSSKSMGDRMTSLGGALKTVGSSMSKNVTLPLVAIGTASVATAANFEKSMSQVAATMGITADEINNGSESFEMLEAAAKEMGATTQFSASEASEALNYLALAGYDAEKAVETLPTVLNLAAAGGIELGYASDVLTDAMSALGLETDKAESFVDEMAKTSQKSNTSVAQLGEAILTVGGTAKVLAGGTNEMNAALGIFADNGIKGAEGGTALRNVILSLSAPTDKAAGAMKDLGLEVFDASGNMRPLNEIFKDLDGTLSTMTQGEQTKVLSELFNKVDLKSVNALLANSGERFDELSGYISESDGAAASMAETMNNNLSGQLTLLKSGLEGAGIAIGEALLPYIKILVDGINGLVTWFNELDPVMQTTIVTVGLIVAAIGPLILLVGSIITLLPVLGAGFAFLTGPIGLAIGAVAALIAIGVALWKNWDEVKAKAVEIWNAIVADFKTWMNNIKTDITNKWNSIKTFFTNTWNSIKSTASNIWNGLVNDFKTWVNNIKTDITNTWNSIKTFTSSVWEGIKNVIDTVWQGIKGVVETGVNLVKTTIETVWNTLENILTAPFRAAKSFIDGVLGGISSAVNGVIDVVGGIFGKSVDVNANVSQEEIPNMRNMSMAYDLVKSNDIAAQSSITESVTNFSKGLEVSKKPNVETVKDSRSVVIHNTYNSPKAMSLRDIKRQDEIQMRRLAMQL